jgi:heat shock protein HspQ
MYKNFESVQRISMEDIEEKVGICYPKFSVGQYCNHRIEFFFGLFRNRSVCFGCFDMDPKHRNEPKQTEKILYWFRKTNRKRTETG